MTGQVFFVRADSPPAPEHSYYIKDILRCQALFFKICINFITEVKMNLQKMRFITFFKNKKVIKLNIFLEIFVILCL